MELLLCVCVCPLIPPGASGAGCGHSHTLLRVPRRQKRQRRLPKRCVRGAPPIKHHTVLDPPPPPAQSNTTVLDPPPPPAQSNTTPFSTPLPPPPNQTSHRSRPPRPAHLHPNNPNKAFFHRRSGAPRSARRAPRRTRLTPPLRPRAPGRRRCQRAAGRRAKRGGVVAAAACVRAAQPTEHGSSRSRPRARVLRWAASQPCGHEDGGAAARSGDSAMFVCVCVCVCV
jgi:hypothetical protein